eukprot:9386435-Pyramimonas_sp.AAC.1
MAGSLSRWGRPAGQVVGTTPRTAGARGQAVGTPPRASSGAQPRSGERQHEAQLCRELFRICPRALRCRVELF